MPKAWFNGRLIDGPVPIDPTDRGLTLGDGVFETIAVFNGKPAYLAPHLDRLAHGATTLGIDVSRDAVGNGIAELLSDHAGKSGILRVTVTRGASARGLAQSSPHPATLITLAPWQQGTLNAPVRLMTSSIPRNEHSPTSRLKTLSYVDNVLAAREAAAAGTDDALLLNTQGRVACSTIANIFIIRGSVLFTPPPSDGVLPGIIRARLLAMASVVDRSIDPAELLTADLIFLTNSIRLMRPVTSIDGKPISQVGSEQRDRLFASLCEEIAHETGTDPRAIDPTPLP